MGDLTGKTALVTGAGRPRGIGHALALRLAKDGADVAVADLCKAQDDSDENWRGLRALAGEIEKLGRKSVALSADITDAAQAAGMIEKTKEALGGIHICCNNAGAAFGMNLSFMIDPNDWRRMVDVNLTGAFLVAKAAALAMIQQEQGGVILNTSSWRGRYPAHFLAAYCAAKAGVIAFTEVMALELAPHNIRVNALCPGKVDTDMERMAWQLKADAFGKTVEKVIAEETAKIPLGRIAKPDEIAGVAAFLASDEGAYMTGQTVYVTGGMTLMNV